MDTDVTHTSCSSARRRILGHRLFLRRERNVYIPRAIRVRFAAADDAYPAVQDGHERVGVYLREDHRRDRVVGLREPEVQCEKDDRSDRCRSTSMNCEFS